MLKNILTFALVLVVGALLGSFLGHGLGLLFPSGPFHGLLSHQITAGLKPVHLDLKAIDLTFGCIFHFNVCSLIGIIASAFLIKTIF